jgi:hypothetical protein
MASVALELFKERGVWLLNSRAHGLLREPLLFGTEKLLDRYAEDHGFGTRIRLQVAALADDIEPQPEGALLRDTADAAGYWYRMDVYDQRGWLGNAGLQAIFAAAPERIFYLGSRPAPAAAQVDGRDP